MIWQIHGSREETQMITGMYTAASGMIVQEKVQDVLAQNLANSQFPGYHREELVVRSFPDVMLSATYQGSSPSTEKPRYMHAIGRVGTGAGIDWIYTDHSPGQMVYTGEPTDFSIFGDGYFSLITPDGMRFSRSGSFMVNKEGYLVNPQGYYLMGQGIDNNRVPAPIKVDGNHFFVDGYGRITMKQPDRNGIMRDVLIDQIRVVDFKDRDKLFREPGNIFRVEEDDKDNITIPDRFQVAQGYMEKSNSIPTTEMVKLMDSYRIHEASARVIRSLDQSLGRLINEVGRVG